MLKTTATKVRIRNGDGVSRGSVPNMQMRIIRRGALVLPVQVLRQHEVHPRQVPSSLDHAQRTQVVRGNELYCVVVTPYIDRIKAFGLVGGDLFR